MSHNTLDFTAENFQLSAGGGSIIGFDVVDLGDGRLLAASLNSSNVLSTAVLDRADLSALAAGGSLSLQNAGTVPTLTGTTALTFNDMKLLQSRDGTVFALFQTSSLGSYAQRLDANASGEFDIRPSNILPMPVTDMDDISLLISRGASVNSAEIFTDVEFGGNNLHGVVSYDTAFPLTIASGYLRPNTTDEAVANAKFIKTAETTATQSFVSGVVYNDEPGTANDVIAFFEFSINYTNATPQYSTITGANFPSAFAVQEIVDLVELNSRFLAATFRGGPAGEDFSIYTYDRQTDTVARIAPAQTFNMVSGPQIAAVDNDTFVLVYAQAQTGQSARVLKAQHYALDGTALGAAETLATNLANSAEFDVMELYGAQPHSSTGQNNTQPAELAVEYVTTGGATRIQVLDFDQFDGYAPAASTAATPNNDRLVGRSLADTIDGLDGNDDLAGSSGNDRLVGGRGADTLLGGYGNDVIIGDATDATFDDIGARVFRIYQATLDRAPDFGGLINWTGRLASGERTLEQVVSGFVNSTEFQNVYGALNNTAFVTLLYNNVLDRAPDAGGLANWVGRLDSGSSRESVVIGFSESTEFRNNTAADSIAFGRNAIAGDWGDDVFRLYQATLDRAPDAGGFLHWSTKLAETRPYLDVIKGFVDSVEFQNVYGATSNTAFVTLLYNNVLNRDPDAAGEANWVGQLNGGTAREVVVRGFAQSTEFINNTRVAYQDWLESQGSQGDFIVGGPGNDILFGGVFSDTFHFHSTDKGTDRVVGLEAWDKIELSGFGFANTAQVVAALTETGNHVQLSSDGVTIIFANTDLDDFTADMFLLV